MGQIGIWQIGFLLIVSLIVIIPYWKILPRAGLHPALSILMALPIVGWILLWILAFKRWPQDQ